MSPKLDNLQSIVGLCSFILILTSAKKSPKNFEIFNNENFKYETFFTTLVENTRFLGTPVILPKLIINVIGFVICTVFSYLIIWLACNGTGPYRGLLSGTRSLGAFSMLYLVTNVSYFAQFDQPKSWFILTVIAGLSVAMTSFQIKEGAFHLILFFGRIQTFFVEKH